MAELLDTVSKQLSSSIEIKKGIAALLVSSADSEQRALDAYAAMKAERDNYKEKYEAMCREVEHLKATIEAMKGARPVTKNFNIGRDYVAAQYLQ